MRHQRFSTKRLRNQPRLSKDDHFSSSKGKRARNRMQRGSLLEYCRRNRDPGATSAGTLTRSSVICADEFFVPSPFDPLFSRLLRFGTHEPLLGILKAELSDFCMKHRDRGAPNRPHPVSLDPRGSTYQIPSPFDPAFSRMIQKAAHVTIYKRHRPSRKHKIFDKLREYAREPVLKKREQKKAPRKIPSGLNFPSTGLRGKFLSVSPFDERFPSGISPRRVPLIKLIHDAQDMITSIHKSAYIYEFESVSPFDEKFPGYALPAPKFTGWKVDPVFKAPVVTMTRLRLDPFPPLTPIAKQNALRQAPLSFGFDSPRASARKPNYQKEKVCTQ